MTTNRSRRPASSAGMALMLGACLLVAGGAVVLWGLRSHADALQRLGAAGQHLAEARAELDDAREELKDTLGLAAWAREHARDGARLGRRTLAATQRLVELNARLLELARASERATLEGRVSDYNELGEESNAVSEQAAVLVGRLRQIFY